MMFYLTGVPSLLTLSIDEVRDQIKVQCVDIEDGFLFKVPWTLLIPYYSLTMCSPSNN